MAQKNNQNQLAYEDMIDIYKRNLDSFESFYFSALMKSGEHGKQGMVDGLYASLWGLRNKIGLEGILNGLEIQGLQSIESGDGLNAQYNLATVISQNANAYLESALKLKVKDLTPYIKDRLKDAEIIEEDAYKERALEQLTTNKNASKKGKIYGAYLLSQLRNSVMAKMVPLAYQERARRETERYKAEKTRRAAV